MTWNRIARPVRLAAMLGVALLAPACESDPVDVGHEEGDVAGFRLEAIDGDTRMTVFTYTGPGTAAADTLVLGDGRTTEIVIVWLDDDGGVVEPDEDEHGWIMADNHSAISSIDVSESDWRADITTVPLLTGATVYGTFSVQLLHGLEAELETPQLVAAVVGD